ncbi:DUF748 domain-containing protein [Bdellovibrio sp. HCB290]|uniref:DUF748 domain-containing protein n=1 Tax=Bdellovibrio sp. HCB290 TaxID=3394356 RepID=UPI0039B40AB5
MKKIAKTLGRVHKAVWVILILLIVVRVFMPAGIKYGINWYMDNKMDSYKGKIEDFDLALYRGAYQIEGLKIWEKVKSEKMPLIAVKQMDISLAWRGIFKGKLLGDLKVDGMKLDLVDSKDSKQKQMGAGQDWKTVIGKLIPIELESFRMANSEIHWLNNDFKVPVDVVVDRIMVSATNIKNTNNSKELLPSKVEITARVQKDANLTAGAKMNILAKNPTFESKITMNRLNVTKLNDFFLAYVPISFSSGHVSLLAEISAKDDKIAGYVKPFIENLDVMSSEEKFDSPKRFFNEMSLATVNLILRNPNNKTMAAKLEFEGAMKGPDFDTWGAVWSSLRNGFVEAMKKKLDNDVSIKDVPKKN